MPLLTFLHSPKVVGEAAGSDSLGDFSNRQGAACSPAHARKAPYCPAEGGVHYAFYRIFLYYKKKFPHSHNFFNKVFLGINK